eukprot:jgi/Ulvmu1/420/UM001_0427.1
MCPARAQLPYGRLIDRPVLQTAARFMVRLVIGVSAAVQPGARTFALRELRFKVCGKLVRVQTRNQQSVVHSKHFHCYAKLIVAMHIKQVLVHGFKSYKDQARLEELSPQVNVVVGANGSGKSNFFHAIRFVIDSFDGNEGDSKAYRQSLLHEGTGHSVHQAWVELVFDNKDRRLGSDSDTVHLRRTITLKEDKFRLDSKHISKREVQNVLEAAGFSRTNPYNIVQQGKIAQMAKLSDEERLNLLKEVGGASLYEAKRKESQQTLESQKAQVEEVDTTLKTIAERLEKLESERQELLEYQRLDRKKRAIEYCILDNDRTEVMQQINKVKESQERVQHAADCARENAENCADARNTLQEELQQRQQNAGKCEKALNSLQKQINSLIQKKAALEIDREELERNTDVVATDKAYLEDMVRKLEADVAAEGPKLQSARERRDKLGAEAKELQHEADQIEAEREALFKQNRQSRFQTKEERDAFLTEEIAAAKEATTSHTKAHKSAVAESEEASSTLRQLEAELSQSKAEKGKADEELQTAVAAFKQATEQHNDLMEERKELWQKEQDASRQVKDAEAATDDAKRSLHRSMPHDLFTSVEFLMTTVSEQKIRGVYGPLIDLIQVRKDLWKATERTAGNRLFQIVVEDEDVATTCIEMLKRTNKGRLTFLPLSRLQPSVVDEAKIKAFDPNREHGEQPLHPLTSKLHFDPAISKAVQTVWGKTLIAKNEAVAAQACRFCDAECVTKDGDKFTSRGTVDGGFVDNKRLRLALHGEHKVKRKALEAVRAELVSMKSAVPLLDDRIKTAHHAVLTTDKARKAADGAVVRLKEKLSHLKQQVEEHRQLASKRVDQAAACQARVDKAVARLKQLKSELASPMAGGITAKDREDLKLLQQRKEENGSRVAKNRSEARSADDEVHEHQTRLVGYKSSLEKKQAELDARNNAEDPRQVLKQKRAELKETAAALKRENGEAGKLKEALRGLHDQIEKAQAALDKHDEQEMENTRALEREQDDLDELEQQNQQLHAALDDIDRKMRDLGALGDAVGEFRGKPPTQLRKVFSKISKEVDKYGSSVNRKALDELKTFKNKQTQLQKRRTELTEAENAINKLIKTLDDRKEACLTRTFTEVKFAFQKVFQELVPGGRGDMHKEGSGVKVRVAFGGHEPTKMSLLSGGQKTLVSLALIFAIQRTDPAPFYLLDEVDAALDPQYRQTVAAMLHRQSTGERQAEGDAKAIPAQFIVTTFHPQIVEVCDKAYGVEHKHRISSLRELDQQMALDFVRQDRSHDTRTRKPAEGPAEEEPERAAKRQKENFSSAENSARG